MFKFLETKISEMNKNSFATVYKYIALPAKVRQYNEATNCIPWNLDIFMCSYR